MAVGDETGSQLSPNAEAEAERTAVSPPTAQLMRLHLAQTDNILEHAVLVLSGPEGETDAWYLGTAPANAPRYALVIVMEATKDLSAVEEMGRALLAAAASSSDQ
jgi:hypothetical protein